jgi:hypothetical protein
MYITIHYIHTFFIKILLKIIQINLNKFFLILMGE